MLSVSVNWPCTMPCSLVLWTIALTQLSSSRMSTTWLAIVPTCFILPTKPSPVTTTMSFLNPSLAPLSMTIVLYQFTGFLPITSAPALSANISLNLLFSRNSSNLLSFSFSFSYSFNWDICSRRVRISCFSLRFSTVRYLLPKTLHRKSLVWRKASDIPFWRYEKTGKI